MSVLSIWYAPIDDFALVRQMRQEHPELFTADRDRVHVVAPARRTDVIQRAPPRISTGASWAMKKLLNFLVRR